MILNCPSCGTRYLVKATAIGAGGRRVRCARCSNVWHQAPALPEAAAAEAPTVAPDKIRPIPKGSNLPVIQRPQIRRGDWLSWTALVVCIVAFLAAMYTFRDPLAVAWPPVKRLYAMVGLEVQEPQRLPAQGLDIRGVHFEEGGEVGRRTLIVRGNIVNTWEQEQDLPRIRIALTDAEGVEIYHWIVTTGKATIDAQQTIPFSTKLPNPPEHAKSIIATFDVP